MRVTEPAVSSPSPADRSTEPPTLPVPALIITEPACSWAEPAEILTSPESLDWAEPVEIEIAPLAPTVDAVEAVPRSTRPLDPIELEPLCSDKDPPVPSVENPPTI